MDRVRKCLLITLVLFAAVAVIPGAASDADASRSTFSENWEPTFEPVGQYAGEPDVGGSTSPSSIGKSQSPTAVQQWDEVVRLAVWIWKTRLVMAGF